VAIGNTRLMDHEGIGLALPIAAGVFEPVIGLVLRPEIAALSMSGSSFLVAMNALLLKRLKLPASISPVPATAASADATGKPTGQG
jgi:Cu2+-exporting ATPase